mgnify:CR=1 FL=1
MRIVFVFLLIIASNSFAQNPYSVTYNLESGLPTSNIYNSFQDDKGYLWFATDVGVLKFNGYEFKHYNTDDGLSDNEVFRIFEDSKKRLWFLTLNGKLSYFKDGIIVNGKHSKVLETASHPKMIVDFFEEKDGTLYFLFRDGKVAILDSELESVRFLDNKTPSFSILKLNDSIQFLTINSIKSFNKKNDFSFTKKMSSLNGYRSYSGNNDFYFSSKNKLYQFKNDRILGVLQVPNTEIIFITKIKNEFWIGTRNGLYIQKKEGSLKQHYKNDVISSIAKDTDNNIWITTLNNGIKFIPNLDVMSYTFDEKKKVNSLKKDGNKNLWIGTNKGLFNLKKDGFQPKLISSKENYIKRIRNYNNSMFAVSNDFIDIFKNENKKRLLFGANDILVNDKNYLLSSSVVFKFDGKKINTINTNFKKESFKSLGIYKIFEKRTNVLANTLNNGIYLGTSTGLYSYTNNKIEKNKSDELSTSILDILIDKEIKTVFLATNSKGVLILNPAQNKVEYSINSKNGLNSNVCKAIEKLDKNTYYIANNKGVNKLIVRDSITVINYNKRLGLKSETINDIEIIDSILYLATNKELLSYNLNLEKKETLKLKLVVDDFIVNGKSFKDFSMLTYTENNIKIKYTGISYKDFGNLVYQYKFENDKTWTTTTNRQLDFKDLPNGNYSLKIKAKSNNTFSDIKHLNFTITPPFWKTFYFVSICIILSILVLYFIVKQRIKKINSHFELERKSFKIQQEKILLEKQMVELKQKALRLQMNPHFIFNALNTIKGYYSGGEIVAANTYISKFSRLLRLILESDEHHISLDKEVETLKLYIKLVQLRYQDTFDYKIEIAENIIAEQIAIPPLLIQPIVENAIIHGLIPKEKKGFIDIKFYAEKNTLICIVKDNGVGFSTDDKKSIHKSKALKITKDRVDFENYSSIKTNFQIIHHKNPKGTEVIIKIPLQNIISKK